MNNLYILIALYVIYPVCCNCMKFCFVTPDCQRNFFGYDYRGPVSHSLMGRPCLPWNSLKKVLYMDDDKLTIVDNLTFQNYICELILISYIFKNKSIKSIMLL